MNSYSNNKPHDPQGFKEEVNIKYNAVKAVVRKFPNGTGVMIELLRAEVPTLDWVNYCALTLCRTICIGRERRYLNELKDQ